MAIMDRRTFFGISAAGALAAASTTLEGKVPEAIKDFVKDKSLKIKFMGTGSAGGIGKNGLGRRHSSILVNDDFIIDFTDDSLDMIPAGVHPETIFYTHSHKDHFQPSAALKIGIKKVYLSHSWYDIAVTPLLANHPTDYIYEEAQIYLIEKDGVRLCGFVFGMGSRCCPFVVGDQVDLVFSAEVNVFRGRESVQLVIKDLHWSGRSESCDNTSQQIYERFTAGEALCREEALSLCPCRDDLVAVFRHIKSNEENFSLCGMPRTLYRKIKYESKCCMNQGRFLICMDIMREFDIFDYERIGENILIRDLQYKGKVDINGSRIIRTLMEVIKG